MSETYEKSELFHLVERVYAQALLELAQEQSVVAEVAEEIQQVGELLETEPDVIRLLSSRTLSLKERDEACVKAFGGRVSRLVLDFFRLLVKKNRFDEFPGMAAAFAFLVKEAHGDIEVQTYVAAALPGELQTSIANRVSELTGRKAIIHEHVDPALLGGLKVRIHDAIIDGSVATQLRLLKQELLEAGKRVVRNSAG